MAFKIDCKMDYKNLEKLMKNMERLTERSVEVGYYDDDQHDGSDVSMGTLANWMEHGVRSRSGEEGAWHIPPRPFMEQSVPIWTDSIEKESAKVVAKALQGKEGQLSGLLDKIGEEGKDAIQTSIDLGNFKELAEVTVKLKQAKGSRFPTVKLVDGGELYEGIKVKVK